MAMPLSTPVESQLHSIIDAAEVVHRRLGPGWNRSIYLAVLEIALADYGVVTVRCSLPITQGGAELAQRHEGLLCDRGMWVHVADRRFDATAVRRALWATRLDRAVWLHFAATGVESRVLDRDAAIAERPALE